LCKPISGQDNFERFERLERLERFERFERLEHFEHSQIFRQTHKKEKGAHGALLPIK
jgi:hypothetical protein